MALDCSWTKQSQTQRFTFEVVIVLRSLCSSGRNTTAITMQKRRCHYSRRCFWALALLCLILCLVTSKSAAETEVQWTANEADTAEGNSGPLPLSMQQRQQLLQLEDVIRKSPNPEATLQQAADANGMSPQDLASMLQRNRSDLEQGAVAEPSRGGGGMSIGGIFGKLITTLLAVITKSASHNPRAFAVVATTLLLLLFLAASAPRTGLVLSSHQGLLSKGPTTVFKPPTRFLEKRLGAPKWQQRDDKSGDVTARVWRELTLERDGSEWHSLPRKSELAKAATAQITIPIESFLEEGVDDEEDIDYAMELCFNHAVDVLGARALTEYAPQGSVRLHTLQKDEGRKRYVALVVKKLGDFGRYGILPLQVTSKKESDLEASLTFSALKAAHFSGQIHVSVEKRRRKKGGNKSIVIAVHLAIPKKGSKLAKKASLKIVDSLAESLATSVKTRTRQSLARRTQSSRFQGKARTRAEERRHSRHEKEKQMEEMAEDRRRKWQRKNPDAGRYRPSGDMMKGPGGSPSR